MEATMGTSGDYSNLISAISSYLSSERADYPAARGGRALIAEVAQHARWRGTDAGWLQLLRDAQTAGVVRLGRGDMPAVFGGVERLAASEYPVLNTTLSFVEVVE